MTYDVIVIGGGAAGLYCARSAGLRGRRVLVLESNARLGNKILISGGGRCNFTNLHATADNYLTSGSPQFARSALARCPPKDFLGLVERHGIRWHEKKLGQLFCDHSSKQILQMLQDECADAGVEVRTLCRIQGVNRRASNEGATNSRWSLATALGDFTCASLVVAAGGLSFPKLGATSFGYDLARHFGIQVIPPCPGLVPLTFNAADQPRYGGLSGLSVDCEASAGPGSPRFRENLLFTHRGLSGPAVLQISSYWRPGGSIHIDLLPGRSALEILNSNRVGGRELRIVLRELLPDRFVQAWCDRHAPTRPLAQLSQRDLSDLARHLHAWEVVPSGEEGYAKAEVTTGGVATAELSSKTMECRRMPGLYFIGEVVDVTGWLGGYNFQWAWASGQAAGQFA